MTDQFKRQHQISDISVWDPLEKSCFRWAAEPMGAKRKPLAAPAATLEEHLAENKAN